MTLPLSVLELASVGDGVDSRTAIQNTVRYAQLVESLGYRRMWFAEHHNIPAVASSTPDVLIGAAAAATKSIKVGAGGVMLPNHAPLQVVERYRTLEALYPSRVELGIGRAPGTDPTTAGALRGARQQSQAGDQQLYEMLAFERGGFSDRHPFRGIRPIPTGVPLPPIWLLGSSTHSASLAGKLGIRYAFAGHFSLAMAESALATYRRHFKPSSTLDRPHSMLALSVICAETDEEIRAYSKLSGLTQLRLISGQLNEVPSIEEAVNRTFTASEEAFVGEHLKSVLIGRPADVKMRIEQLAEGYLADEVMVSTAMPTFDRRSRSLRLLAEEFGQVASGRAAE